MDGDEKPILKWGGKCDGCGIWHDGEHEKEAGSGLLFGMTFCKDCEDKWLGLRGDEE